MEKIIIYIVVIIGAILFEQIKKYARRHAPSGEDEERETATRPRRDHVHRHPPVILDFERNADDEAPSSPVRKGGKRLQSPIALASRLKPLPEEGESMLNEPSLPQAEESGTACPAPAATASAEEEERDIAAHYERWRRAMIDTQILERKF